MWWWVMCASRFVPDEAVAVAGVSAGPMWNPFVVRGFGRVPFCGQGFEVRFRRAEDAKRLCVMKMLPRRMNELRKAIKGGYVFEMRVGEKSVFGQYGFERTTEENEKHAFVFTHFEFECEYVGGDLSGVVLSCKRPARLVVNGSVEFTYSVAWKRGAKQEGRVNAARWYSVMMSLFVDLILVALAVRAVRGMEPGENEVPFLESKCALSVPRFSEVLAVGVSFGAEAVGAFVILAMQYYLFGKLPSKFVLVGGAPIAGLCCGVLCRKFHANTAVLASCFAGLIAPTITSLFAYFVSISQVEAQLFFTLLHAAITVSFGEIGFRLVEPLENDQRVHEPNNVTFLFSSFISVRFAPNRGTVWFLHLLTHRRAPLPNSLPSFTVSSPRCGSANHAQTPRTSSPLSRYPPSPSSPPLHSSPPRTSSTITQTHSGPVSTPPSSPRPSSSRSVSLFPQSQQTATAPPSSRFRSSPHFFPDLPLAAAPFSPLFTLHKPVNKLHKKHVT